MPLMHDLLAFEDGWKNSYVSRMARQGRFVGFIGPEELLCQTGRSRTCMPAHIIRLILATYTCVRTTNTYRRLHANTTY
jgi:hypothetical protein